MNQGTEDRGQGAGDSGHPFGCALELTEDMGLAAFISARQCGKTGMMTERFRQQWPSLVQPEVPICGQPTINHVFGSFIPWKGLGASDTWSRYYADNAPARTSNEVWTPEEIHTRTARRIDSLMLALEDLEQQARLAWSVKCLELIRKLERRHRREIRIRLRCLPGMELLDPINS